MLHPPPPALRHSLTEVGRAFLECHQLWLATPFLRRAPAGDGHPVMTLPGFGGADGCMAPLRGWLRRWGYDARPWELGRNFPNYRMANLDAALSFRDKMVDRAAQRIEQIYRETGQPLSLIGWSLGGIYASELAQRHPDRIRRVITLGTPHGDPRGTAAWNIMRRAYNNDAPEDQQNIEQWLTANRCAEHEVPITVIYSPRDGIVGTGVARIEARRNVENLAVDSSHLGFAMNPRVYWQIARCLAQPPRSH